MAAKKKIQNLDVPTFVNHTEKPKKSFCERLVRTKFWLYLNIGFMLFVIIFGIFTLGYMYGCHRVIHEQIITNDNGDQGTYYSYFNGSINEYYFEK